MQVSVKHILILCAVLCTDKLQALQPHSAEINGDLLPHIKELSSKDFIYTQYCDDVEQSYMASAKGTPLPLIFYAYKVQRTDTLFTIAAACSIPYDTIATVNGLPDITAPITGHTLILPTEAGVFIPDNPSSSIEILMQKRHLEVLEEQNNMCYTINNRDYRFLEKERFSSTERAFFLDASLRMPLERYWLSSAYGMRISPISGKWKFHQGIDMAAPEGTSVYACKSGTASICCKNDPVFGNYIILKHDSGMTSVYAHLSRILIQQGEQVSAGSEIGKVGMTGAATGPHLHFEIRINNVSTNPQGLLKQ